MKPLKSKEAIEKAKRWASLKKRISKDQIELDEIKTFFSYTVKNGEAVTCGKYVIGSTLCSRTSLDKEAILAEMGQEFVQRNSSETKYIKLDIKVAAKDEV